MLETFIVNDDGSLLRIPCSVMQQLRDGAARLPQYSNNRVKCAEVVTQLDEDGVPQGIARIVSHYLTFDSDGYRDLEADQSVASNFLRNRQEKPERSGVVDLQRQKEKREQEKMYRWEVSAAEMQAITNAALGHPRAVKNVKSVKTPPSKKIETWPAEKALRDLSEPFWKLETAIDQLDEDGLMVLADLLADRAKLDGSMAPVWMGMREVCLRNREIQRLHRTGEDSWCAVVDMIKWNESRSGETVHSWQEKCESRKAAGIRAREIALSKIELIDSNMTVEVRVYTDLEHEHGLD